MSAKRYLITFVILSLLLLLVPACGGGGEEAVPITTAIPTATPTPTQTSNISPTPTNNAQPVKLGALASWSGPTAISGVSYGTPTIKFTEKLVNDAGGILGGRPIQFVKYDVRGSAAEAVAGCRKLILEDKVSILALGGETGVTYTSDGEVAEELKVPFIALNGYIGMEQKKFSAAASPPNTSLVSGIVDLLNETLKPKTVAFLQMQTELSQQVKNDIAKEIEAAGIETVYSQDITFDTSDLSPFLTKIKYLNPDVVALNLDSEKAITLAKQITELGGWGSMKVVGFSQSLSAAKQPGAEGWIVLTTWVPGRDYPAAIKFEQDWKAIIGGTPSPNHVYFYDCLLTAVEAIKFAGTDDPIKINEAIHSGNLKFDTPMGIAHFDTQGHSGLKYMYVQIQKGGTIVEYKR